MVRRAPDSQPVHPSLCQLFPERRTEPQEPKPAPAIPDASMSEGRAESTPPPSPEPRPAPLDAASVARHEQLLVAWLERHKRYPRRAKRLRIEGEGMLYIRIDRTGQTRKVTLARSTGDRLLDKAAPEMAQQANPFPPFPEKARDGNWSFMCRLNMFYADRPGERQATNAIRCFRRSGIRNTCSGKSHDIRMP